MVKKAYSNLWYQNLAKPEGFLGQLVGQFLAIEYFETNMWSVQALNVQPEDKILEVGFGPGLAIKEIARRASYGYVVGIDYSELMLARAKKENAKAIRDGLVTLRHADVLNLPNFGVLFDKIVAINNAMYWKDRVEALKKLKNTLKPGGFISIVIQRNEKNYLKGGRNQEIHGYMEELRQAGFVKIRHYAGPVQKTRKGKEHTLAGISIVGFKERNVPN